VESKQGNKNVYIKLGNRITAVKTYVVCIGVIYASDTQVFGVMQANEDVYMSAQFECFLLKTTHCNGIQITDINNFIMDILL
jgi:hypothetical protein